jgi:hypothetical protein
LGGGGVENDISSRICVAMFVLSTEVHKKLIGYKQTLSLNFQKYAEAATILEPFM